MSKALNHKAPQAELPLKDIAKYLTKYTSAYRQEYARLIASPPRGAGFPDIVTSPYLKKSNLTVFIAQNGTVLVDQTEPAGQWYVAGGPALMVDFPDTRVPESIQSFFRSEGLLEKNIGIYRLVFPKWVRPEMFWEGVIPPAVEQLRTSTSGGSCFSIMRINLSLEDLIAQLTFGAFGPIIDVHLPSHNTNLWQPMVVRELGFITADRKHRRFLSYAEFLRHNEVSAWDPRSVWARAKLDAQRDLAYAISAPEPRGASFSIGGNQHEISHELFKNKFNDRLAKLEKAIVAFEELLKKDPGDDERNYQEFLEKHPLLLDIYGQVIPRPRFVYPEGVSPLGKKYVEPDFVVCRPFDNYRIIEIERPSKKLATKTGQARAEVTQASFQIAEFLDYVREHHEHASVKSKFPGIHRSVSATIIISRATEESLGGRVDIKRHMQLLKQQLGVNELLTYDDLLAQAKAPLQQLAGIAPSAS